MEWEKSLEKLNGLGIGAGLQHRESLESAVTTSWGVKWDEVYIARDIMQNFYDANRGRLTDIQIDIEGSNVTISAPTQFNLKELFYLGSTKGDDDVGQYGEGFKAAAMCLLRDYQVNPIAISGNNVLFLRVAENSVDGTLLRPIVYDFFESSETTNGFSLIFQNCTKQMIKAFKEGMTHFYYDENPILGQELWSSHDDTFMIYASNDGKGHVFYQNLKRGEISQIPIVLVINKKYSAIEKKIAQDRDRNAFGEEMMKSFYNHFARYGVKHNVEGQRIILEESCHLWERGHALLAEIASHAGYSYRYGSVWPEETTKAVFGEKYFARSYINDSLDKIESERIESDWMKEGKHALPKYFSQFGLITAIDYLAEMKKKAFEERKKSEQRNPTTEEGKSIDILLKALRDLSPELKSIYDDKRKTYSIADTEVLLGELKKDRGYNSCDVFLSSTIFTDDFAIAFSVFLHEHAHIFGYDGSRKFTDALTRLIENVVRKRSLLDGYENEWILSVERVIEERKTENIGTEDELLAVLASKSQAELSGMLMSLPSHVLQGLL